MLLLDEPTNDLDVDTLRALEDALDAFPGCAVVISHDRWFLDRVATHVLAFEGDSEVRWFEGNFSDYEAFRRKRARRRRRTAPPHQVQAAGADLAVRRRGWSDATMPRAGRMRALALALGAIGIAGMIVSSIAGSTGAALAFGLCCVAGFVVLFTLGAARPAPR